MSGRVVHFEIPYQDAERAQSFYREAFGWQITPMPELGYTMVATGSVTDYGAPSEHGYINGGMLARQGPIGSPVLTIGVDDIDAVLAQVADLGGATVVGRQPVGEMGFSAYFTDPDGNLLGLWQTAVPSS